MIETLTIEGFRRFEQYRLEGIRRVNLLVGRNNCGKSTVLEAVRLLASSFDTDVLNDVCTRRGEVVTVPGENGDRRLPVLAHLFHGHELVAGACFHIKSVNERHELKVAMLDAHGDEVVDQSIRDRRAEFAQLVGQLPRLLAQVVVDKQECPKRAVPVTQEGGFSPGLAGRSRAPLANVRLVTPEVLLPKAMGTMWDHVVTASRKARVVKPLSDLVPGIDDLHFSLRHLAVDHRDLGGVEVHVAGEDKFLPLGNFGEGLYRLLALSLSIAATDEDGTLLIDEIDTGLHYSIMEDLWRLVIHQAVAHDIQVFATTHSRDCLDGLARLCRNEPQHAANVSVQKLDRGLRKAVALDASDVIIAAEQDIEVRG